MCLRVQPWYDEVSPTKDGMGHARLGCGVEELEVRRLLSAQLMKDVSPGANQFGPMDLVELNGAVYFFENDGTEEGLWRSDGTPDGTVKVRGFHPSDLVTTQAPLYMVNVNGTLYFAAADGDFGHELWKSDGTPGGTVMVKDINTSEPGAGSFPGGFVTMGGGVFFTADDGDHGRELWRTDGTAGGTAMIDLWPGQELGWRELVVSGTSLYFSGSDRSGTGSAVWKSDGTAAGTLRVIGTGDRGLIGVASLVALDGTLYFMGDETSDFNSNSHLWKTDGTPSGTARVSDASAQFTPLEVANGALYFTGADPSPHELFGSDGTAAGTVQVTNLGGDNWQMPQGVQWVNGRLVFLAGDRPQGFFGEMTNLYSSDGTVGGTRVITQFADTSLFPVYDPAGQARGRWYFAGGSQTAQQLWTTDGTPAGTARLTNLAGGLGFATHILPVGSAVYFFGNDGNSGVELWKLDEASIAQAVTGPTFAAGLFLESRPAAPNFLRLFDADTVMEKATTKAYEDAPFDSAVRLARADFSADGVPDVVMGPGPGPASAPRIRVLSGSDGSMLSEFLAFDAGFLGGVSVATGDVTGDGMAEVIVAADAGAGPHVKVFTVSPGQPARQIGSFWAFDPAFAGGVWVAAADFDGDGRDDVIASAGPGAGPHVKVFDGRDLAAFAPRELASFWAGDVEHRGGGDRGRRGCDRRRARRHRHRRGRGRAGLRRDQLRRHRSAGPGSGATRPMAATPSRRSGWRCRM